MKHTDVLIGSEVIVNGDGDRYMCIEDRPFLRRRVTVLQMLKGGEFLVRLPTGEMRPFPARNLDPAPELNG